ncbi:MAG: glycosyl transferase [Chloroflexi bacterium]|nr:glycosyl transferase [Chloroflexota bacterium]
MKTRLRHVKARDTQPQPEALLRELFPCAIDDAIDAQFVDSRQINVVGAAGLPYKAPVVAEILKDAELYRELAALWQDGSSILILGAPAGELITLLLHDRGGVRAVLDVPRHVIRKIADIFAAVPSWGGTLNADGHHIVDLKSPSPGPHYFVNVLLGNRVGFPRPLQTTPKSVVDRLGRGSFRSHAATQVLATRWDMRPEENGFPANRQFYLVEDGRQIFYSASPTDPGVESAHTVHAQNRTIITYRTRCGLEIRRLIFILPQEDGLPLATEVQSISIANRGDRERNLKVIVTGMFGAASPGALQEDVLYTNLAMQASVLRDEDGAIIAVSPDYNSAWNKQDVRFHSTIVHAHGRASFPTEFCTSYNEFVGEGTLENPEGLLQLSNTLARKGPGFFALAADITVRVGEAVRADNFTGLVSAKLDPTFGEESVADQIGHLVDLYSVDGAVDRALARNLDFIESYVRHMQVESGDHVFDEYVNNNLPFQILYQTFFSRSFCQTQKGYREIGFREIQDLFASMPFLISMGQRQFVKDLLKEWGSQIYEFGYANHNFYWTGKEPGEFSDDALWFVQAIDIYLNQTGDFGILDEKCHVAGAGPERRRSIYEAIEAVLRYSGEVSIGKHGLPLLDKADWNDTLRLDYDFLDGPRKEAAYLDQVQISGQPDQPLESDYSESVMNAFLLAVALEATRRMAERRADAAYAAKLRGLSDKLRHSIQKHAWKDDFFARVLLNRFPDGRYTYLGARGDGLSADPDLDGTYFLNSFSWSILANIASEDQIRTMLRVVKRVLLTPHGLRLCSPVKYGELSERGGSGEYFVGDRENGGVFKHANMMATTALFKAAKEVEDQYLAAELAELAYSVVDKVLPFRTLGDPYVLRGNPRFCTQYNNSETGENVGPLLSGTSSWLWLTLMAGYGISVTPEGIELNPVLQENQHDLRLTLNTGRTTYRVEITKPARFCRVRDDSPRVMLDGMPTGSNIVPLFKDGRTHDVKVIFGRAS